MSKSIEINVADVIAVNRIRETEPEVERLAKSMQYVGQLQDIIINQNNRLVGGGRRLAAAKLLGWETISAKIKNVTDEEADLIEVMENNEREEFSFAEKLKITHMLEEKAGERRGRPKKQDKNAQDIDNTIDKIPENFPDFSNLNRDDIAAIAGWGSHKTMGFALTIEKCALPEVVRQIGNKNTTDESGVKRGGLSIYGAFRIAQLPKKKQIQALNEAVTYLDNEGADLSKSNNHRRAAKRKDKTKTPKNRLKHQQYNVVRVAPNWDTETESDILSIPVNDYTSERIAVVAVECPGRYLANAMDCLAQWEFQYVATVTAWNPKRTGDWLELTTGDTAHIVLGIRHCEGNVDEVIRFSNLVKTAPVHAVKSEVISESLIPIIEAMFPDYKNDRRLDMSSTEPRKSWIVWKIAYSDDETAMATMATVDAELIEQAESGGDDAGLNAITESDGVLVEQQEADLDDLPASSLDLDVGDDDVFEPIEKRRGLKIFG